MKLGIAEIMEKASKAPSYRERIEILKKYDNISLRTVFWLAYSPDFVWDLPEKWRPEYHPSPFFDQQGTLYQSLRKIDKFRVDGYPGLTTEKKQMLFIQFLEGLDKDDAMLMAAVCQKKIPYKGLGRSVIRDAFPGLLPTVEEVDADV